MIGWLLDTNVITELISSRGSPRVKAWASAQDEAALYLSILTIGEYEKGITNLHEDDPRRAVYMNTRDSLAVRFADRLLSVSDAVVRRWGTISGEVRRRLGHSPPVIDTLLAATAIEHNLYFATRHVRDVQMSGARVFNPWNDDPSGAPLQPRRRHLRSGPLSGGP
ncbi:MAG: type II toxin-antitoxin system VapC family toxin [Acetobacteraceae bacterium]|nr:type II toxin-antitoxin system VapC family toxin [Acetobacteraceae bacterium]